MLQGAALNTHAAKKTVGAISAAANVAFETRNTAMPVENHDKGPSNATRMQASLQPHLARRSASQPPKMMPAVPNAAACNP